MRLHAACVSRFGRGILLRGPSGAGKSTLALALIQQGWMLVADDQVELTSSPEGVYASAPATLRGWLEAPGLGLCPMPTQLTTRIALIVDLIDGPVLRLPVPYRDILLGCAINGVKLTQRSQNNAALIAQALRTPPHIG